MIVAGIDYSMTSPAICIHDGSEWKIENCTFYYLSHNKKNIVNTDKFSGSLYEEYEHDAHRYSNLSKWSMNIIKNARVDKTFIEGYAFNAVGRVFQIAENTGILKYNLWKSNIPTEVFAPPEIKKFATLKGNANKQMMYDCFVKETGVDIRSELDILNKDKWNPVSDIVDSYYIAKFGFVKEKKNAS